MPTSYGIAHLSGFDLSGVHTTQQLALMELDDQVTTVIEPVPDWRVPEFQKYEVRHETVLHLEARYQNRPISKVVEMRRFPMYLSADNEVAYFRAKKKLWKEAMHRLQRDGSNSLQWHAGELDLHALQQRLQLPIAGGWFGQLQMHRVRTVGIYGTDVSESEEWDRYDQAGRLQAIMVELPFGDEPSSVMLTHDWTVLLYRDFGELANLEFVENVRQIVLHALNDKARP